MPAKPQPPFSPRALLRALTTAGVDFVIIGGVAGTLHGVTRMTGDLDIAVGRNPTNLRALGSVLIELGATLRGIDEDVPFVPDAQTPDRVELLTLDSSVGAIDIHLKPPGGVGSYDVLRNRADRTELEDLVVLAASIDDLLTMKRAAGRPKDLLDAEELEEVKRQLSRKRD